MTAVSRTALDPSLVALQRRLRTLAPDPSGIADGDVVLERLVADAQPPRLVRAEVVEGGGMRARRVFGDPLVAFAAFLDGTQASHIVAYSDGFPIVLGTVAAVIRLRRNRRLTTWNRPVVRRRLYAPVGLLSAEWNSAIEALDIEIIDTTPSDTGDETGPHPFTLRDIAVHRVQQDREAAEQTLAERWCHHERDPIFIDGGISGSEKVAVSSCTVGVVKSHRTLYADGAGLQAVLRLRRGERSSVFRITSPKRTTVASWYLRLRDQCGHDPMWGLVRVEIAQPPRPAESRVGARADEVSRWILAEVAPLTLPDARWDKMAYGIRDCEEFLRAVT